MANNKQSEICYMCGRPKAQVHQLLKGKYGYICDSCVNDAHEILRKEEEKVISKTDQESSGSVCHWSGQCENGSVRCGL